MAKKSYPSREERMKDLNQRLEQGIRDVFESERFRDYLSVMSRFHTYSARNVLLIHMQRPNATRVASAKRWKEQFERFINKGEKAIYIMAPIPRCHGFARCRCSTCLRPTASPSRSWPRT